MKTRPLPLLVLSLVLAACGPERPVTRQPRGRGDDASSSRSSYTRPEPARGPRHDWSAMLGRVRDLEQRKERILDLMRQSVDKYKAYKRTTGGGSPDESLLDAAKKVRFEAGDLWDRLYSDVISAAPDEDVGETLWRKRLGTFQRRYDRLADRIPRKALFN